MLPTLHTQWSGTVFDYLEMRKVLCKFGQNRPTLDVMSPYVGGRPVVDCEQE